MRGTAADVRHREPDMTVERAVAVAYCPAEGRCVPSCPHCTATADEVKAARAWLDKHPDQEDAWAIGKLASVASVLHHWTAEPATGPGTQRWRVNDGAAAVADDLTHEQAEAIARQHNREVTATLGILDWYLGA